MVLEYIPTFTPILWNSLVRKYTIHRAYGIGKSMNITIKPIGKASNSKGQAARPTGGDTWSSQQTVVTGKQPWPAGKSTI
jgi:hypothetical protein